MFSISNGLAVPGNSEALAGLNSTYNRLGMFSDIYYDRNRDKRWGVADRGPDGGVLSYDTRIERFTLTVNGTTGAISNFAVAQTVLLNSAGVPLNGLAPNPVGTLGNSFDPEGLVVNPHQPCSEGRRPHQLSRVTRACKFRRPNAHGRSRIEPRLRGTRNQS